MSGKYFRVSQYEHRFLKALDGKVAVEDAQELLKAKGYFYSAEDCSQIVGKAAQAGLLLGTQFGTSRYQKAMKKRITDWKRGQRLASLYFLFIPLVNPDRFLQRTVHVFRLLCNRWTALLAVLALPGAVYLLISGLPRIHTEFLFFFNLTNLLYLWVTIALTKLAHELAHAYTAKAMGLHVPQMGIVFLIFFPCLFCNTTDAWQLADRRQRMAISAAGVVAEMVLAIFATYVWYFSKPGILNSVALYMMGVSLVSTILVNGNPLLKFDGYFLLVDLLRIPNLYQKSFAHLRYLFMNGVLGVASTPSPARNSEERAIFTVYGLSSFIYRMLVYIGIAVGVYYRFDKTLGILLAALAIGLFMVRPAMKGTVSLYRQRSYLRPGTGGVLTLLASLFAVALLFSIPIPGNSVYPCFLDSAKKQKLTVPLQTWVDDVHIREGTEVATGELLFTLDTSVLNLSLLRKEADRETIKTDLELMLLEDQRRAEIAGKEIELYQVEDEIRRIRQQLAESQGGITAPFDGVVTKLDSRMKRGFQPGEGVVVGELESTAQREVHGLIPERDLHKVSVGQEVRVVFNCSRQEFTGKVLDIKPFSEKDLRESPFSSRVGGELATEVRGQDQKDSPLEAQFDCLMPFGNSETEIPLGMTGRMAVPVHAQSIGGRVLDTLSRTFNRESFW
ncbi:MAG: efflux RND transporter periplasmic adaptor subunit [Desulfomonile tiedjei]|nr:efflux RND transporter periplasmic adaptor subunit [Desulfomonile tiedjei]